MLGRHQDEHDAQLHGVLQRLEKSGITLNVDKCELSRIGHQSNLETLGELRNYLSMVNQLGKFFPQLAASGPPLNEKPLGLGCGPNTETKVPADASSYGLRGVLHKSEGEWRAVAYASRLLLQMNNSVHVEKGALGLTWTCEWF